MKQETISKILIWAKKNGISTKPNNSITPRCDCDLHRFGEFLKTLENEDKSKQE